MSSFTGLGACGTQAVPFHTVPAGQLFTSGLSTTGEGASKVGEVLPIAVKFPGVAYISPNGI